MDKQFLIIDKNCIGCGKCKSMCPVDAIYKKNKDYIIDQDKCIKCRICFENCGYKAITDETISE